MNESLRSVARGTSRVARVYRLLTCLVLAAAAGVWLESTPQGMRAVGTDPFRELEAQAGLTFVHDNGARGQLYLPEIMGSGVALFDYDGDGDLDVYLVQGKPLEAGATASAKGTNPSTSRLFRNDLTRDAAGKPVLHFTDVTEAAGVGFSGVGMGAAVADYDNDGHLDLLVTGY